MSGWQVASQFRPGTTTEYYTNLIAANISEAATIASWLPLLVLCVIDFRLVRHSYSTDADPEWRSAPARRARPHVGRDHSLATRAVVTIKLCLRIRSLAGGTNSLRIWRPTACGSRVCRRPTPCQGYAVATHSVRGNRRSSVAARVLRSPAHEQARGPRRAVRPNCRRRNCAVRDGRRSVCATCIACRDSSRRAPPLILGWGLFNPLQSTRVMFRKPETKITRDLDALAATRPDGAIAVSGVADAVLNGVGYRSVTHVLATPRPHVFRKYFPGMDERKFNAIFNRYAHIWCRARRRRSRSSPSRMSFGCRFGRWISTRLRG